MLTCRSHSGYVGVHHTPSTVALVTSRSMTSVQCLACSHWPGGSRALDYAGSVRERQRIVGQLHARLGACAAAHRQNMTQLQEQTEKQRTAGHPWYTHTQAVLGNTTRELPEITLI